MDESRHDVHDLSVEETKEKYRTILEAAIMNWQGSPDDLKTVVTNSVEKLFGKNSKNPRNFEKIPQSGQIFWNEELKDFTLEKKALVPWKDQLQELTIYIFDCETTSLWSDSYPPDFTEISVWKLNKTKIEYFHQLVNPSKPQTLAAIQVSGLEPSQLRNAPTTMEVLTILFSEFITLDGILIAHNGKGLDFKMLNYWKKQCQIETQKKLTEIDSMDLFRKRTAEMPRNPTGRIILNQPAVYEHLFREKPSHAHCAFYDVWALARILTRLFKSPSELISCINEEVKKKSEQCSCQGGCQNKRCGCVKKRKQCVTECKCWT